jgi:hypothetical protein
VHEIDPGGDRGVVQNCCVMRGSVSIWIAKAIAISTPMRAESDIVAAR